QPRPANTNALHPQLQVSPRTRLATHRPRPHHASHQPHQALVRWQARPVLLHHPVLAACSPTTTHHHSTHTTHLHPPQPTSTQPAKTPPHACRQDSPRPPSAHRTNSADSFLLHRTAPPPSRCPPSPTDD